jgi:1-deoxy-D-xylulose-5-phosphate reductoisomerase
VTNIALLGSTGSIGVSTLDVVRRRSDQFRVFALVAGRNAELLARQVTEFRPAVVVAVDDATVEEVRSKLPRSEWPEFASGPAARVQAATAPEVDFVLSAIVGVAGLEATYEAVRRGKRIGLANKEVLVASGELVIEAARQAQAELIPVDSEHNGAHQCLRAGRRKDVTRLILTASGGPFRNTPIEEFEKITPEAALNHPTWRMGKRITIDSATLMNKGFEVIEACWLFGFTPSEVDVVVHPQSSVHAMIEFSDGSIIAQISATDMRMPIQYALTYPDRCSAPVPRLDWTMARKWEFHPPDMTKFPALRLAYEAQEAGGSAGCTLNAADEIAVEAFLREEIAFSEIPAVIEDTLSAVGLSHPNSVEDVLAIDERSRQTAREIIRNRAFKVIQSNRLVKA